jgi:hypothetical protein
MDRLDQTYPAEGGEPAREYRQISTGMGQSGR